MAHHLKRFEDKSLYLCHHLSVTHPHRRKDETRSNWTLSISTRHKLVIPKGKMGREKKNKTGATTAGTERRQPSWGHSIGSHHFLPDGASCEIRAATLSPAPSQPRAQIITATQELPGATSSPHVHGVPVCNADRNIMTETKHISLPVCHAARLEQSSDMLVTCWPGTQSWPRDVSRIYLVTAGSFIRLHPLFPEGPEECIASMKENIMSYKQQQSPLPLAPAALTQTCILVSTCIYWTCLCVGLSKIAGDTSPIRNIQFVFWGQNLESCPLNFVICLWKDLLHMVAPML